MGLGGSGRAWRGDESGCEGGAAFCLSVSAVLAGGVCVDCCAVGLLAIFARRHPLVYPVQTPRLLEVAYFPRGRKALNSYRNKNKENKR